MPLELLPLTAEPREASVAPTFPERFDSAP